MQVGRRLHFVQVIVQGWWAGFQPLPLLALLNNLVGLGAVSKGTSWKDLPVVEHALWEGLASGVGPQVSCEAKGLIDRQVGLDHKHGGAGSLCLLKHVSSPSVQHTIDSSNRVLRALDFNKVDWLHQPGVGSEHGGVEDSPGGGNDLTSSPVDGVRVQGHVVDVEPDGSQVSSHITPSLVAHWNPATTLSLISFRYCTPLEQSISRLGPLVSGPKHQIFLASVTS